MNSVSPGENVKAKLKGIEEEDVSPGFVLCDLNNPVSVGKIFDAQVSLAFLSVALKLIIRAYLIRLPSVGSNSGA